MFHFCYLFLPIKFCFNNLHFRDAEVNRDKEYRSAVCIQSWYRGIRIRSYLKYVFLIWLCNIFFALFHLVCGSCSHLFNQFLLMISKVLCFHNMIQYLLYVNNYSSAWCIDQVFGFYRFLNECAVRIQRHWRGFRTRAQVRQRLVVWQSL